MLAFYRVCRLLLGEMATCYAWLRSRIDCYASNSIQQSLFGIGIGFFIYDFEPFKN